MATRNTWKQKDLTGIETLSRAEIDQIFAQADRLLPTLDQEQSPSLLRGRTIVNLFLEPSTRTRTAFEISAKRLGAEVVSINTTGSSLVKGETLRDTALNIQALKADAIVLRHSSAGAAAYLGRALDISVINAGDGTHEHPSQALLDAFTIRKHCTKGGGDLSGLRIGIVGDVLHSRVARSNVLLLALLGAHVTLIAPPTLLPFGVESWPVDISYDFDSVLPSLDAVMMLRVQQERMSDLFFPNAREYSRYFGLNRDRMLMMKANSIIMHPGPMNRGLEITADVADSARSVIVEQVSNGVSVRMAILYLLLAGAPSEIGAQS